MSKHLAGNVTSVSAFHVEQMKKDYLHDGAMADTADLVVLGAYYGTGNKGNFLSIKFDNLSFLSLNFSMLIVRDSDIFLSS